MTCSVKVVQLNEIYMCTEFHMNTCKYVWAIHQVFRLCSRGRRRAPVPRPGPSLCGVLMAADSNVCANFQEFLSTLRPPKVPGRLKKKINRKKIIILWKTIGPCALLAWALTSIHTYVVKCCCMEFPDLNNCIELYWRDEQDEWVETGVFHKRDIMCSTVSRNWFTALPYRVIFVEFTVPLPAGYPICTETGPISVDTCLLALSPRCEDQHTLHQPSWNDTHRVKVHFSFGISHKESLNQESGFIITVQNPVLWCQGQITKCVPYLEEH